MNKYIFKKKIINAIKNPSYVRNFIYGKFKYFPVSKISNSEIKNLPVYCISLKGALSRRLFMKKQVKNAEFTNFNFIDAVNASTLNYEDLEINGLYDDNLSRKFHNRSLNLGEIACSLSHGRAYEIINECAHPVALILEDDALFVTKFINAIDISIFPKNWDIVFINSFYSCTPPIGHITGNLYTTESWKGSCAAYLISQKGASNLANKYKPVFHAADGFVGRCMSLQDCNVHAFKQQGATTTINAYLIYPDAILNGSSDGFWSTSLPN